MTTLKAQLRSVTLMATLAAGASAALYPMAASADDAISIGLITKTETTPFFVKMREAATEEPAERGATLIPRTVIGAVAVD